MQGTTTKESYTYDVVGNRTYQPGAPYTYNTSNEMLTREGVPYTYDANGNTLSKTTGSGATTYAWDFENRLTSVTLPGTGGTVTFQYDPFGRRIQKSSPSGTTTYVYDDDNIIEELTGSTGTLSERYTYGPGVDEPLVGQRQPKIFYYEADGLGSVTSLTDPTGAVAATYTYDSFGFMTNSTGSATNWYRYTGRQFDSDTALYYYRARYYDPTTGRFLNEDPARFSAGVDFYTYVGNRPLNFRDPSGRCPAPNNTPCAYEGTALSPSQYAAAGAAFKADYIDSVTSGDDAGLVAAGLSTLYSNFQQGGSLDAQPYAAGDPGQRASYGNYAFGVFFASAGVPLDQALSAASAYGYYEQAKGYIKNGHSPYRGQPLDPVYGGIPVANVQNITLGYNDQLNGTTCQ